MLERIDLKVGFRCNNFCKFCVQGNKREQLPAKPLSELLRSLERGRERGADGVVVTGGEPTIHPNIIEIVGAARSLGYNRIQIQSNGRAFCYDDFCRRLIAAGANEFSPSLHGSKPEIHDALTNASGSFMQTVSGIRNLKRLGQRVIINSVVTRVNLEDLPEFARLLVALGADQFQFAFPHITGRAAENDWLVPRKSEAMPLIKAGLDVGLAAGIPAMTEGIPYCFMRGYENCVAEKIIPSTMIFDAESVIEDYSRVRSDECKAKGPPCVSCARSSVCEGPWKEYPDLFGWSEFKPL